MTHTTHDSHHETDHEAEQAAELVPPLATHTEQPTERPAAFTLRIPKPNWQVSALLLIALIAGFQTFQLVRLKNSVSAKTVATSTAAPTSSGSTSSSAAGSDLQAQVGGC